jgi:DNA-binding transcriptional LysR family regulator
VELLARTTRSVAPTAAGAAILRELGPALERIEQSLAEARKLRDRPAGRIRLVLSRSAAQLVLMPRLRQFCSAFPEVELEVTCTNDPVDLVAGEYDAGIQIGEFIERDMIAVRVSGDVRLAAVAAPGYLKRHGRPRTPRELKDHACIAFRFRTGVYRWEFEKGRKALTVLPQGPLTFDDPDLVVQAAVEGAGIGMAMEGTVAQLLKSGRLEEVLEDWCPRFPGYFLYYPSRRNRTAALAALIQTLRL